MTFNLSFLRAVLVLLPMAVNAERIGAAVAPFPHASIKLIRSYPTPCTNAFCCTARREVSPVRAFATRRCGFAYCPACCLCPACDTRVSLWRVEAARVAAAAAAAAPPPPAAAAMEVDEDDGGADMFDYGDDDREPAHPPDDFEADADALPAPAVRVSSASALGLLRTCLGPKIALLYSVAGCPGGNLTQRVYGAPNVIRLRQQLAGALTSPDSATRMPHIVTFLKGGPSEEHYRLRAGVAALDPLLESEAYLAEWFLGAFVVTANMIRCADGECVTVYACNCDSGNCEAAERLVFFFTAGAVAEIPQASTVRAKMAADGGGYTSVDGRRIPFGCPHIEVLSLELASYGCCHVAELIEERDLTRSSDVRSLTHAAEPVELVHNVEDDDLESSVAVFIAGATAMYSLNGKPFPVFAVVAAPCGRVFSTAAAVTFVVCGKGHGGVAYSLHCLDCASLAPSDEATTRSCTHVRAVRSSMPSDEDAAEAQIVRDAGLHTDKQSSTVSCVLRPFRLLGVNFGACAPRRPVRPLGLGNVVVNPVPCYCVVVEDMDPVVPPLHHNACRPKCAQCGSAWGESFEVSSNFLVVDVSGVISVGSVAVDSPRAQSSQSGTRRVAGAIFVTRRNADPLAAARARVRRWTDRLRVRRRTS